LRAAAQKFAPPADTATRDALVGAFKDSAEAYTILQSTEAYGVHAEWLDVQRANYGEEVWKRIDRGRHWSPAQLTQANAKWNLVREAWQSYFKQHDFLVMPATPFAALTKAECTLANRNHLLALNAPASLGGLAVLTIPVALPSGLSSGLQIIAPTPQSPAISWALKRV
jgi:amidase/aspartyl-tRNA(Asn)/glutamyl-tRNA(Gln) amidotransferase subunit A